MKFKTVVVSLLAAALAPFAIAQTNTFPSSGSAGIGTTSPGRSLTVYGGSGAIVGDTTSGVLLQGDISGVAEVTGINTSNNTNNPLAFYTGINPSIYINTSGNV